MARYTAREELYKLWGLPTAYNGRPIGHIKIKPVRCGKEACKSCPYYYYAYHVTGSGREHKEKYLGGYDAAGYPRAKRKVPKVYADVLPGQTRLV